MTDVAVPHQSPRPERNSLDVALEQALAGQRELPMRWIITALEQDPRRVMAVYLAGHLLRSAGDAFTATQAFRVAARWSVREGSMARAAAAVCELKQMDQDVGTEVELIAEVFSTNSPCLMDVRASSPPELIRSRLSINPVAANSSESDLLSHIQGIIAEAFTQLDDDSLSLETLCVPRQALFSSLDAGGVRALLSMLELRIVTTGTKIVVQGEPGEEMFVVVRGEVEVARIAEASAVTPLARLGSGSLFGEMALLSQTPRAAQVVACRPSILLVLRKDALDTLVTNEPDLGHSIANYCRRRMIDNLIRTSAVLRSVNARERSDLVQRFVTCTFETGQRLITQDEEPEGLHLIASGSVAVVHKEAGERTVIATLGVGEVVGEMSLVLRRPSNADVVATTPTVTLHLTSEHFLEIVRAYPGMLSHLYELAITRDVETRNVLLAEAEYADELVLL